MDEDTIGSSIERYRAVKGQHERLTKKLHDLLEELLHQNHISTLPLEFRTKSEQSLVEKLRAKGARYADPLTEVTDLSGVRIVTYYLDDVKRVGDLVETTFVVDWDNSVKKANILDADRFGYLSRHYVVALPESRLAMPEWKDFVGMKAEIQVRTVLQHAWAAVEHALVYKRVQEAPPELRRPLHRLSALFELADEQFSEIRKKVQQIGEEYGEEIRRGNFNLRIDLTSLDTYLNNSEKVRELMDVAKSAGYVDLSPHRPWSAPVEREGLLSALEYIGVTTIAELDETLAQASAWAPQFLRNAIQHLHEQNFVIPSLHGLLTLVLVGASPQPEQAIRRLGWHERALRVVLDQLSGPIDNPRP